MRDMKRMNEATGSLGSIVAPVFADNEVDGMHTYFKRYILYICYI